MNTKHLLAVTALLISSQGWALTAQQKNMGCPPDTECPFNSLNAPGGGGGEMSVFTGSWMYGGSHWESYEDSQGGFDIETTPDGKVKVHMGNAGAFLIKPPPKKSEMSRSKLAAGAFSPALTLAQTKKKAEDEKAAAAAKAAQEAAAKAAAEKAAKAAADKAAADAAAANKAAAVYTGPALSAQPAGGGVVLGARKKP
jgi:hypothetical protein